MYSFQKTHLISLVGVERAERWYEPLRAVFMQYGLTNPRRQAHFLAQLFHESLGLAVLEENLNYKVAVDQMNASNPNVQEPFDIINWEMDEVIRNNMEEFGNGNQDKDTTYNNIVDQCDEKLAAYVRANG